MKKNSIYFSLLTIMMVAIVSVCFASCSSDDENKNENGVSLIGTWRWDHTDESIIITFNSNGTGRGLYYDNYKLDEIWEFKYVFSDNKLYFEYFSESSQEEVTDILEVISLTASHLLIKGVLKDGAVATFVKQ